MPCCLIKRAILDRDTRGGKMMSVHRIPENTWGYQKVNERERERRGTVLLSQPSEGTNVADIFDFELSLQNCVGINFCYLSHLVCGIYSSPRKLIQDICPKSFSRWHIWGSGYSIDHPGKWPTQCHCYWV